MSRIAAHSERCGGGHDLVTAAEVRDYKQEGRRRAVPGVERPRDKSPVVGAKVAIGEYPALSRPVARRPPLRRRRLAVQQHPLARDGAAVVRLPRRRHEGRAWRGACAVARGERLRAASGPRPSTEVGKGWSSSQPAPGSPTCGRLPGVGGGHALSDFLRCPYWRARLRIPVCGDRLSPWRRACSTPPHQP